MRPLHGKTHQVMPRLNTGSWQTSFRNLPDFTFTVIIRQ
jgi:hypothetical protein